MSEYFQSTCTSWLMLTPRNLAGWRTIRNPVVESWLWYAVLLSTPRCICQARILVRGQPLFVQIYCCLHAFWIPGIQKPKLVCRPCFPMFRGIHVFCSASLSTSGCTSAMSTSTSTSTTQTCTYLVVITIISTLLFGFPLTLVTNSFRHLVTKKWNNQENMKKKRKKVIKCKWGNYCLQVRKQQRYFLTGIYSFRQWTG